MKNKIEKINFNKVDKGNVVYEVFSIIENTKTHQKSGEIIRLKDDYYFQPRVLDYIFFRRHFVFDFLDLKEIADFIEDLD